MDRGERRRLDRELQRLVKKDGDRCTACHGDFPHNSKTYYGRAGGRAAIVGDCCRLKLSVEVGTGLYVKGHYEGLKQSSGRRAASADAEQVEAAIHRLQKGVAGADAILDHARARAGISGRRGQVSFAATSWKADDAAWFKAHPQRSHRQRALLEGEADSFPPGLFEEALPVDHEIQVIIRQIEPGRRARLPFGRNLAMPIPDDEAILHALFDRVAQPERGGPAIRADDLAKLARRYGAPTAT